MTTIQIYALPRSGLSFLTAMLNLNPRCMAYHELHDRTEQASKIMDRMQGAYDYVVDLNTDGWIKERKPADIRICIRRDTPSALRSTAIRTDTFIPSQLFYDYADQLDRWAVESGAMVVYYEHLFRTDTLQMIWETCFNSNNFPVYKVAELLTSKIERNDVKQPTIPQMKQLLYEK
jgi:hypothetical protein